MFKYFDQHSIMTRIATWNVNSLRIRLPQVISWCQTVQPDILALQETKLQDEQFPQQEIEQSGYQVIFSGQKTYNGVAILSKQAASEIINDLPGLDDPQRRLLAATFGRLRIINVYVPNGQSVDSEKYHYKLSWLARLKEFVANELTRYPQLVLLGDFNITPDDRDVYDPQAWHEKILCSTTERQALHTIMSAGLADTFRLSEQPANQYSWWDYRMNGFKRNQGLRIDLTLASPSLCEAHQTSRIDTAPRGWERPSDHAPVIAEFAIASEA